ncbi:putative sporulation protein YtaF [Priestia taiwanensis]|uniref:Sporulation membrane protein YtaF n=2 Tax=Priestia taiwanensis TaxID=1347902 RepID=A0A917EQT2_9BACI|nr:sporulation membrane protein YtaF [Priestia taiwanensis]MBM7363478.1 putative sporulation protein YtaF [Priestia taiwanensis]GGE76834.1 sporulation membrane protein YtaF [Priestia taiwanensis]
MPQYVSLLLLACALSLDSCSVGFTYGLRKVHIPLKSIIVISICSAAVLVLAMGVGYAAATFVSPEVATKIGGVVLIAIGVWVLIQFFKSDQSVDEPLVEQKTLVNVEIKWLGIVIHILRKPTVADIDKSGTITGIEALLLGISLSLDSFGAGIGASLLGYSPLLMALFITVMGSSFLLIGMRMGKALSSMRWLQRLTFLPGILLIIIGIWKM